MLPSPINKAKGIPASIIEEDRQFPQIKPAKEMQQPQETMWYDEMDEKIPPGKIIDNNDAVDNEKLQKHNVKITVDSELTNIRQKLINKNQPKKIAEKVAAPGEFVIIVKGHPVHIGDLVSTKEKCEEVIISNEDLDDDDLLIFMRVPIGKIIK